MGWLPARSRSRWMESHYRCRILYQPSRLIFAIFLNLFISGSNTDCASLHGDAESCNSFPQECSRLAPILLVAGCIQNMTRTTTHIDLMHS